MASQNKGKGVALNPVHEIGKLFQKLSLNEKIGLIIMLVRGLDPKERELLFKRIVEEGILPDDMARAIKGLSTFSVSPSQGSSAFKEGQSTVERILEIIKRKEWEKGNSEPNVLSDNSSQFECVGRENEVCQILDSFEERAKKEREKRPRNKNNTPICLLHGFSGVGKSFLLDCIANKLALSQIVQHKPDLYKKHKEVIDILNNSIAITLSFESDGGIQQWLQNSLGFEAYIAHKMVYSHYCNPREVTFQAFLNFCEGKLTIFDVVNHIKEANKKPVLLLVDEMASLGSDANACISLFGQNLENSSYRVFNFIGTILSINITQKTQSDRPIDWVPLNRLSDFETLPLFTPIIEKLTNITSDDSHFKWWMQFLRNLKEGRKAPSSSPKKKVSYPQWTASIDTVLLNNLVLKLILLIKSCSGHMKSLNVLFVELSEGFTNPNSRSLLLVDPYSSLLRDLVNKADPPFLNWDDLVPVLLGERLHNPSYDPEDPLKKGLYLNSVRPGQTYIPRVSILSLMNYALNHRNEEKGLALYNILTFNTSVGDYFENFIIWFNVLYSHAFGEREATVLQYYKNNINEDEDEEVFEDEIQEEISFENQDSSFNVASSSSSSTNIDLLESAVRFEPRKELSYTMFGSHLLEKFPHHFLKPKNTINEGFDVLLTQEIRGDRKLLLNIFQIKASSHGASTKFTTGNVLDSVTGSVSNFKRAQIPLDNYSPLFIFFIWRDLGFRLQTTGYSHRYPFYVLGREHISKFIGNSFGHLPQFYLDFERKWSPAKESIVQEGVDLTPIPFNPNSQSTPTPKTPKALINTHKAH